MLVDVHKAANHSEVVAVVVAEIGKGASALAEAILKRTPRHNNISTPEGCSNLLGTLKITLPSHCKVRKKRVGHEFPLCSFTGRCPIGTPPPDAATPLTPNLQDA